MTPRIEQGDFENELRDLFREKAEEAPLATPTVPTSAPQQVLRRGRLHQAGTVLGSVVVVVALIVGSVAGLTRILGEGAEDRNVGDGGYEIFQRTATVEAFTVGSPSDWYLVNEWPLSMTTAVEGSAGSSSKCVAVPSGEPVECDDNSETETTSPIPQPHGLPMLQLSNVDLGLATNACAGGLPADAAVLYVALDYDAAIGGIADPSIQEFPPGPGLPPEGNGPCGAGRYAYFTVNGERFFSWIGVGTGVSDEDREIVETSYEMMSAIPDWEPSPPNEATPAYVIAGGAYGPGEDWRLELRPSSENVELSLQGVEPGGSSNDFTVPAVPIESCCSYDAGFAAVTFGAVSKQASGVELEPSDGSTPIDGRIVPLPPTIAFDFDLFFIPGTAGLAGHVVPVGIDGTEESLQVAEPRADEVELAGEAFGQRYRVRFTGAFADETACIRVTVADVYEPLCLKQLETSLAGAEPSMHVWVTNELALFAGAVPPRVDHLDFFDENGREVAIDYECRMGPLGWTDPDRKVCAIALPPGGSGTLRYNDANGVNLFQEDMGWGSAEAELAAPVEPVHGGTYWAVYPWVGDAGSPEANDMSAQLLEEFGIEAFPGDLSCDDGAAEALGTNAPQGIGVYFETEEEANEFALQAGLLDHTRPVIARVTTYCLD
jgi:hypothetical protein